MSRYYTDEFKRQIVAMRREGKTVADLTREYGFSKPTVFMWDKQYANSGKFMVCPLSLYQPVS